MKIVSLILQLMPPAISAGNSNNSETGPTSVCKGKSAQFFNHDDPNKPHSVLLEKSCGDCCCSDELNHLDCGTKKMTTWKQPDVMDDRDYTHIYLNDNRLKNITSIQPSDKLRSIQASENQIEESFSLSDLLPFPNLEYLTLSNNAVSGLKPLGIPHTKLAAIDFSKNSIKMLKNGTFEGLVGLRWMNLAHNSIESFDKGMVFQIY